MDEAFEAALFLDGEWFREGFEEGRAAGLGDREAYVLGAQAGRELGQEMGYCVGLAEALQKRPQVVAALGERKSARVQAAVARLLSCAALIDWKQPSSDKLSELVEEIRAKYRLLSALLGFAVEEEKISLAEDW